MAAWSKHRLSIRGSAQLALIPHQGGEQEGHRDLVSGLLVEQTGAQPYPAPSAPLLTGCRRSSSRHTPFPSDPVCKTSSRRTTVRRLRPAARAGSRQGTCAPPCLAGRQLPRQPLMFVVAGSQLQVFGVTQQDQPVCNRYWARQQISFPQAYTEIHLGDRRHIHTVEHAERFRFQLPALR